MRELEKEFCEFELKAMKERKRRRKAVESKVTIAKSSVTIVLEVKKTRHIINENPFSYNSFKNYPPLIV